MSEPASERPRVIGAFVVLYLAVGAYSPYLPVYYRSLGLSLDLIGLLAALFAAAAMLGAPLWGATADRSGSARPILAFAAGGAAVAATLLGLVSGTVLVAVAAVLMALAMSGIIPILDARALEVSSGSRSHYASFRVWGSASYIVAVVLTGWIVEALGPRGLFTVLVPALLLTAVVGRRIRSQPAAAPITRLTAIGSVLRSRSLAPFLAVVLITWTSSTTINAFFSIHLVDIGAPSWMVGLSWALGAAVEVPIMLGFGWLVARVGLGRLLLVGTVLFALRAAAVVLTSDPLLVTLSMALHGGAFALFLVGGVSYVAERAPAGAAATAQGMLVAIAFGLAQIVGPGVGGLIAADGDLLRTFGVAGAGSVMAVIGMTWIVRRA
ncbi:MAG TPA: MFS transporter [Candidatus Limnocylindria bacterium]|nr:MFS transporter [Candidatus Limnocylindria bacterium]